MIQSGLTRRSFLLAASALVAGRWAGASSAGRRGAGASEVEVTIVPRASGLGRETVSFGLPLPPGLLSDARDVAILDERGREVPAAVRALEPWRVEGRDLGIRSVLVQFTAEFAGRPSRKVRAVVGRRRRGDVGRFAPVAETLVDAEGLGGPRVMAVLPARWLCDSLVVGPQTPASDSGEFAAYERFVEKNFSGSLAALDSQVYHEWLFDRTNAYQKMYARTGDAKFLTAAYHAAHFLRLHTEKEGPDAGTFTLKGRDLKYVYPRAMHVHYLLTGDERALATGCSHLTPRGSWQCLMQSFGPSAWQPRRRLE